MLPVGKRMVFRQPIKEEMEWDLKKIETRFNEFKRQMLKAPPLKPSGRDSANDFFVSQILDGSVTFPGTRIVRF